MTADLPADASPAEASAPGSDHFARWVAEREAHYSAMSTGWVALAEPSVPRLLKLHARAVVHLPLSAAAAAGVLFSSAPVLDGWAVLPAVITGILGLGSGLWAKEAVRSPGPTPSLRADAALAHADFRAALATLAEAPVDVVMAVRLFESNVDAAMQVLLAPESDAATQQAAVETLTSVGARAWAMARVEEVRHAAVESAVARGLAAPPEPPVLDAFHPSSLDFGEMEAVARDSLSATRAVRAEHEDEDATND